MRLVRPLPRLRGVQGRRRAERGALENFVRENPDQPKKGETLWEADFRDQPYFQQCLRADQMSFASMGVSMFMGFVSDSRQ